MSNIKLLLEEVVLGSTTLPNQVSVAPMTRTSAAPEGLVTDQMVSCYTSFARDGFGLVITEGTYVDEKYSQSYFNQSGIAIEEHMHAQAILKYIQIVQETDSELPSLFCDCHQIKRAFINILQNAIEATSDGGVITIQTMPYDSDYIKFRFIDQGCGISEDRIHSMGESFYSTKEKGTGLGLMISHKIVQVHGGTIHFESAVHHETTVDIILPLPLK